jgi:hypothetical protein
MHCAEDNLVFRSATSNEECACNYTSEVASARYWWILAWIWSGDGRALRLWQQWQRCGSGCRRQPSCFPACGVERTGNEPSRTRLAVARQRVHFEGAPKSRARKELERKVQCLSKILLHSSGAQRHLTARDGMVESNERSPKVDNCNQMHSKPFR